MKFLLFHRAEENDYSLNLIIGFNGFSARLTGRQPDKVILAGAGMFFASEKLKSQPDTSFGRARPNDVQ